MKIDAESEVQWMKKAVELDEMCGEEVIQVRMAVGPRRGRYDDGNHSLVSGRTPPSESAWVGCEGLRELRSSHSGIFRHG